MKPEDRQKMADLEARNQALEATVASFSEREQELTAAEAAARRKDVADFCGDLVEKGQLLPRHQAGLVEFMASLPDAEAEIEFAQGEGDTQVKAPRAKWLRDFLSAMPVQVDFSERGAPTTGDDADNSDAHNIAKRAVEFQQSEREAGRTVSVSTAVKHVITTTGA